MSHETGVYRISISDYAYIGSAENTERRWREHLGALKRGKHINPFLQNTWNKYQVASFELITICPKSCLLGVEQFYLNKYWDGQVKCMNISRDASAPMAGRHHSEWTKVKFKLREKRYGCCAPAYGCHARLGMKHTEETKAKMRKSKIHTGKMGRYERTEEWNKANSERQKGLHHSPSSEFKKGCIPPLKGKKMSEEAVKKMTDSQRKRRLRERTAKGVI